MQYIPYVNTRMGSASAPRFSHGNTLPYTQLPWAMAGFVPQTAGASDGWFFHADDRGVEGIRLTHQPSPWIGDYGTFLMTPEGGGRIYESFGDGWSGYRPEEATFRPDLLRIRFLRQRCEMSVAPTCRGGMLSLHYDLEENMGLTFHPILGENGWRYDASSGLLWGWTNGHSQDKPVDFKMYIAVQLDVEAVDTVTVFCTADHGEGCHVMFCRPDTTVRIGISYLTEEQALYNLREDMDGLSFDAVCSRAEEMWEEYLHRIEIDAVDEAQARTFYSCLYRTALFPHKAYEHDWQTGAPVHYSPFTGKRMRGVRYTDNGFWDTYRTVYPLYAFIARDEYAEMLDGFVADWRDGGWLPRWPSIGEVGCMPSTLIDAIIAEAAVKGIGTRALWTEALEGMLHHANHNGPEARYGRNGAEKYVKLGYMPRDMYRESVNLTLDAAYGDYCIARVLEVLGYDADFIENYDRRAKNYCKLFDAESGFMRGRDEKGARAEAFDPLCWGGEYTEGCAWQTTFSVQHDVTGLAALFGGREQMVSKLDELFAKKPEYAVDGYGREIHEMTELAALDFGQCAISNQPSFHIPFLYAMLGEERRASEIVKRLATLFRAEPQGYPGDEDTGSASAWYIFAVLGIYPVCPGMPGVAGYAKTDMLVRGARILGRDWDRENVEAFF